MKSAKEAYKEIIDQIHSRSQDLNDKDDVFEVSLSPRRRSQMQWKEDESWSVDDKKKVLETLDFFPHIFKDDPHKLLILVFEMFDQLGLIESFQIPTKTLQNYLLRVHELYRNVPFHNFFHAFNVTQTMYYFLTSCNAKEKLSQLELLALIISCLCHDLDHPGVNNTFQMNARTKLSILYNDLSILEQHHCSQTFFLLQKEDCNILQNLDLAQWKLIRKFICSCILSTDLSSHAEWLNKLKEKSDKISWENFDDKQLIMCSLVKCADISNEIRPGHISIQWAELVSTEFFVQTALEKERGLPTMDHMDPDKVNIANAQIGFIEFLCMKIFLEMTKIFPSMKVCVDQLQANSDNYKRELASTTEQK